jgi:hypothetical protein
MDKGINIVVFHWGDWPEHGWEAEYVNRLFRGVSRQLTPEARFACFAQDMRKITRGIDPELGIEVLPLLSPSWLGCLPKLYAFSPTTGLKGRVLVFDLDTVIVGSLDDIASYDGPLATRAWFKGLSQRKPVWLSGGDLLSFEAGANQMFWDLLSSDPVAIEEETGGRERYVYRNYASQIDYWQDLFPGQVVSYKNDVKRRGLPENARVVSCHGNPRPHKIKEEWAKENWI